MAFGFPVNLLSGMVVPGLTNARASNVKQLEAFHPVDVRSARS